MWKIGKHKYRELERKIEICMQENIRIKNEVNEKIYDMAKKSSDSPISYLRKFKSVRN